MKFSGLRTVRRWPALAPRGRGQRAVVPIIVAVMLAAGAQLGVAWATALPANAVLRTGNTVITKDDFQRRTHVLEALYGIEVPPAGKQLDTFNKDVAKSIAVSLILDDAARRSGIVIADKNASDALQDLIDKQLPGGRQAFDGFLATARISEPDVLDEVKRQLATNKLFDQLAAQTPPVTDADTRAAFDQRRDQLAVPERRQLRNIVVASQADADQVLVQAQSGADFGLLASASSLDQSSKDKGGDIGTLSSDQLDQTFAKAAFAAPVGAFFGPVQTGFGWNVGQVVNIEPGNKLSYDEASPQLKGQLDEERKLGVWQSWLGEQIEGAHVEYADAYRPDNPDAPPAFAPR
ncbi:peptidylprolyl isomerase [Amycolatopsis methanolica]|uniref:PpiC-type peptidyl-prolyl cis-trans isomerase n=1 Tax=Amycolatopsis methanolica 239 TaxID=1068978 RepID=A0A076MKP6_AMYME|nr:peptidyl-prolyl cis-trans isomerase [Amycolatopsis methanolica]AIJ21309.1 PpiC-type peptidyl-prolyl cis-trans isomerase [Amycolatopsis methanolica 239]